VETKKITRKIESVTNAVETGRKRPPARRACSWGRVSGNLHQRSSPRFPKRKDIAIVLTLNRFDSMSRSAARSAKCRLWFTKCEEEP
jgi:hypothetical protein